MTLRNTLIKGKKQNTETVTLYHVSTEVDAFKSFFREGAKSIGKGLGGQTDGFYVWTTKKAADGHVSFLDKKGYGWCNKALKGKEALIIGLSLPLENLRYPLWQQDLEQNQGLVELAIKYAKVLNSKAHDLNIFIPPEERPFGWPFHKITALFVGRIADQDYIFFEGIDAKGILSKKICPSTPPWEPDDTIKFQILTDWLCQNSSGFKKDYDALMRKILLSKKQAGLKYTGSAPLPITFAQYVKVNADGSLKKTTLFDAKKSSNQVCPFLTMGFVRERKI